jgi:hypothetical protein
MKDAPANSTECIAGYYLHCLAAYLQKIVSQCSITGRMNKQGIFDFEIIDPPNPAPARLNLSGRRASK